MSVPRLRGRRTQAAFTAPRRPLRGRRFTIESICPLLLDDGSKSSQRTESAAHAALHDSRRFPARIRTLGAPTKGQWSKTASPRVGTPTTPCSARRGWEAKDGWAAGVEVFKDGLEGRLRACDVMRTRWREPSPSPRRFISHRCIYLGASQTQERQPRLIGSLRPIFSQWLHPYLPKNQRTGSSAAQVPRIPGGPAMSPAPTASFHAV